MGGEEKGPIISGRNNDALVVSFGSNSDFEDLLTPAEFKATKIPLDIQNNKNRGRPFPEELRESQLGDNFVLKKGIMVCNNDGRYCISRDIVAQRVVGEKVRVKSYYEWPKYVILKILKKQEEEEEPLKVRAHLGDRNCFFDKHQLIGVMPGSSQLMEKIIPKKKKIRNVNFF